MPITDITKTVEEQVLGALAIAQEAVVDALGVDTRAVEERREGESQQVSGVPRAEGALALAERRADDVDDDGFSFVHSLTR